MPLVLAAVVPEPIAALLRRVARQAADLGLEVALVGGAVRDLLLGRAPADIDMSVAAEPAGVSALAGRLVPELGGTPEIHQAFGTASLQLRGGVPRLDLAMRRREHYPRPGALPLVEPGSWEDDLARRDFTINAMAWFLTPAVTGREPLLLHPEELLAVPLALSDLSRGLIRVLHDQSFRDDPTRLVRAARTAARLGFRLERRTRALAKEAVQTGALGTLSPQRTGQEVRLTARDDTAWMAFTLLDALGLWAAVLPAWTGGAGGAARRRLLEEGLTAASSVEGLVAEPWQARLLAWLAAGATVGGDTSWLHSMGWSAADTAVLEQGLRELPGLSRDTGALGATAAPSDVDGLLGKTPGAVQAALYACLGKPGRRLLRTYWQALRSRPVLVSGRDLERLGWTPGPDYAPALSALRARVLDGDLPDRASQLDWLATRREN